MKIRESTKTIHVSNLSKNTDCQHLRDMFSQYGSIISIKIGKDSAGKSRGFALIEFSKQ